MTGPSKALLFCWMQTTLEVLVPKRRGAGYLKVPLGHHHNEELAALEHSLRCDIYGLDGSLSFQCGAGVAINEADRRMFQAVAMPALERIYGMRSQEVNRATFWELHPVPRDNR